MDIFIVLAIFVNFLSSFAFKVANHTENSQSLVYVILIIYDMYNEL